MVGVGRTLGNLEAAVRLGVIDRPAFSAADALSGADLVLLAVPVGQMGKVMDAIAPYLNDRMVVTDAGSTKQDVVALARHHLKDGLARFVPGHPIAGAEKSGVEAARPDLFDGRNIVLTPLPENTPDAVEQVRQAWVVSGARVSAMEAQRHDRIFAAVSHLPHLLAFALVDDIAAKPEADELFAFAASGFRDFTRIAGSSPEMWRDICLANREALLQELDAYRGQLDRLREALAAGDGVALEAAFTRASRARNDWVRGQEGGA